MDSNKRKELALWALGECFLPKIADQVIPDGYGDVVMQTAKDVLGGKTPTTDLTKFAGCHIPDLVNEKGLAIGFRAAALHQFSYTLGLVILNSQEMTRGALEDIMDSVCLTAAYMTVYEKAISEGGDKITPNKINDIFHHNRLRMAEIQRNKFLEE